jgi:hypothetical protein
MRHDDAFDHILRVLKLESMAQERMKSPGADIHV